ncbi:permease prefix domain 1-containing protein [Bacillus sp. FJAT-22090]|uniref:permease prefix domain 1-containing protein n=1 Tax=Bacillus sp. FJAT-22090 TaxID=1581038 RepID=UPI000A4D3CEC|nr:permease prefix domain 1-containing protein [Bacillus sp. FJAT-22090]
MKQIEGFVDSVYQNVGGNKKELQELKAEMKSYLLEAVHELKLEGKSEQVAVEIAIKRFGKENELRSAISEIFETQKVFGKMLLYIGIAILLLSTIVFSYFLSIGNQRTSEQSEIAYEIGDIVESNPELSEATEEKIEKLLNDAVYIKKMNVYLNEDRENPVYELNKSTNQTFSLMYSDLYYGSGDINSFIEIKVLDYRNIGFLTMFFGFTCFVVLFIIWAIINIYHKKRKTV